MGANFQDTEVLKADPKSATTVWEEPVDTAYYVIGADPTVLLIGLTVSVFRFFVAMQTEWNKWLSSPMEMNTYQFAWVIAHLAGARTAP